MVNSTRYRPPFSYKIWAESESSFGLESFHCAMRRGFNRARKNEPEIGALRERDNSAQAIGHLAQQGVYKFHSDPQLLDRADGVKLVIDSIDRGFEPSPRVSQCIGVHTHGDAVLIHGHVDHSASALGDANGTVGSEFRVLSAGCSSHRRRTSSCAT